MVCPALSMGGRLWSGRSHDSANSRYKVFHDGIDLEGKNTVVIGRSNIVGKPMAQLLLAKNTQL